MHAVVGSHCCAIKKYLIYKIVYYCCYLYYYCWPILVISSFRQTLHKKNVAKIRFNAANQKFSYSRIRWHWWGENILLCQRERESLKWDRELFNSRKCLSSSTGCVNTYPPALRNVCHLITFFQGSVNMLFCVVRESNYHHSITFKGIGLLIKHIKTFYIRICFLFVFERMLTKAKFICSTYKTVILIYKQCEEFSAVSPQCHTIL